MLEVRKNTRIGTGLFLLSLLQGRFMVTSQYSSILSLTFWKAFWLTMRPYLIFISGAAGMVGLAFMEEPETVRVVFAFIPLFFSYGLGQALTDCFQMDTDALSSPYRPLIKGVISRRQVLSASLIGMALSVLIMTYLNPIILIFGILAVLGLITYTTLKRTWWGGPVWNSWIVALLPVMGRLVDRDYQIVDILDLGKVHSLAFFLAVLGIFFCYANFVVMGYFKDISADRKTGYRTFPVVFGWKPAAVYSDVAALAAAFFTGWALFSIGDFNPFGIAIFIAAIVINISAQVRIHRIRDEKKAYGPIADVVRSFILYSLAIVVSLKSGWMILIVIFYLLFELTLRMRPEKKQV